MFPAFDSGEFHPTYVDGVVEAIIAIVEEPAPAGTIFNIGGERPIRLRALRALIAEVLRVRPVRLPVLSLENSTRLCADGLADALACKSE